MAAIGRRKRLPHLETARRYKTELKMRSKVEEQDTRLRRLARSIDALADHDQDLLNRVREITALRRRAAAEIHTICAEFVVSLNQWCSIRPISARGRFAKKAGT